MRIWATALILQLFVFTATAQTSRISNYNAIGWYAIGGTFNISPKWGLNTEYVWRRTNFITHWQQGLSRVGVNYYSNKRLTLRLGYVWGETFPYGEIPINKYGKMFNEHRLVESLLLTDKLGKAELSHRFMLEQRWVGSYSNATLTKEDTWNYMNRLRYMVRLQTPWFNNIYSVIYDELFIGFGKNVQENIFDQNRLGLLIGCKINPSIAIEAGYLSQILQLGREVNGHNVFQYNNGFIISTQFKLNVEPKHQ